MAATSAPGSDSSVPHTSRCSSLILRCLSHAGVLFCFKCDLRRRRRGYTLPRRRHQCQNVHGSKKLSEKQVPNQFDSASSDLLTVHKNPNQFETRRSFERDTRCAHTTKTDEGTHRIAQKPNQPRLLSTSCISWHNLSRAVWQLNATFATSQS